MSVLEALPSTTHEANKASSDYWLEQSEGFQVFGPNGRIGSVALVLASDEGVDGLVIRTGLFRTRSVFVPVHEVGTVVARRKRLELLITPRAPRARMSDLVRELFGPATDPGPSTRSTSSPARPLRALPHDQRMELR